MPFDSEVCSLSSCSLRRRSRASARLRCAVSRWLPAIGGVSLLPRLLADQLEPFEQLVLDRLVLLDRERSALELAFGLRQHPAQRRLVAELALGLHRELLRDPDRPANGCERKRQESGQEAHGTDTKLCGGRGPMYLKSMRPSSWRARSFIASSKSLTRSRSTRNDAVTTWCSIASSATWTACAGGCKRARMPAASRCAEARSSAATSSPSSILAP